MGTEMFLLPKLATKHEDVVEGFGVEGNEAEWIAFL